MKRKLVIVLFLTALLLTGIIAVQAYWSLNAYKLNKEKFDSDINTAMQQALDSCKKDYFDSIRVVMVNRLSDTGTHIKLDTVPNQNRGHGALTIHLSNKYWGPGEFNTSTGIVDFYRRKINHKATVPEVLTEMSFYVPALLDQIVMMLGMEDFAPKWKTVDAYAKAHSDIPRDTVFARSNIFNAGTLGVPSNYRRADSVKLYKYYRAALDKVHPRSEFILRFSDKPIPATPTILPKPFSSLWRSASKPMATSYQANELVYSETDQYSYQYHGFLPIQHAEKKTLFVRAVFDRAQVGVLKEMILPLLLSGLLIVFTIFCFNYIIRIIIRQKKLTELKDDFINNMTHELKTPIATITVAIEGLQKYNALSDPEKTQRYLQTSRNELSRLNDLVSKVLNVAAFENKQIGLNKEKIAIDDVVNDLIASETLKTNKKVTISYDNKGNVKFIEADKLHLRNVLANLIDNAIKYCDEPVDIKINLYQHNTNAVFSVKDNGIGIPPAHIKQVFDKFHRVPTGNVHNVKGTGLGLNYVKYIVKAHGGSVTVKSEKGQGSEFIITIPLKNG
nr:HAMP domain-containing sensor histidine kinase [Mucilaginibacter sp. L294]